MWLWKTGLVGSVWPVSRSVSANQWPRLAEADRGWPRLAGAGGRPELDLARPKAARRVLEGDTALAGASGRQFSFDVAAHHLGPLDEGEASASKGKSGCMRLAAAARFSSAAALSAASG